MKKVNWILILSLAFPFFLNAQIDTTNQEMVSMTDTYQKTYKGEYRYFKKGNAKPYEGVLFGKHSNGNYASIQEYKNGLGDGTWINFYENGNIKESGTYQKNKVAGPIQKFYPSGKIKSQGTYRDWRIRVGEWTYYNENGAVIKTEDYGKKGDLRDVEDYYQRGEISEAWYQQIISN